MKQVKILGIDVDDVTLTEAVDFCGQLLRSEQLSQVITLNPEMVMNALETPAFSKVISEANLVVPDGHGIIWGAEHLGTPLKEQVPGVELLIELLEVMNIKKQSVYFYGAKEEVIAAVDEKIKREYPGIKVLGYSNGYLSTTEEKSLIDSLNQLRPDYIFVALGSPRQEYFIYDLKEALTHGVAIGVGGSFDVLSGHVKRAPQWIQKIHMEWLYRFFKNPSRLKRILVIPRYMRKIKKSN